MLRTIQGRLLGSYLLLVVVLVLAIAVAVAVIATRAYIAGAERDMLRNVVDLAKLIREAGRVAPLDALVLRVSARITTAHVLVLDSSGVVLSESHEPSRLAGARFAADLVTDVLRSGAGAVRLVTLPSGDRAVVAAAPLRQTATGGEVVALYRPIGELRAARRAALVPLWRAGALGLLLAIVFAYVLARGISEPLRRITLVARQLAAGRTGARTGLAGDDELGKLGQAFDHMALQVDVLLGRLTEERDRVRAILEGVSSGLFAADADGVVLFMNEPARSLLSLPAQSQAPDGGRPSPARTIADFGDDPLVRVTREALAAAKQGGGEPIVRELTLSQVQRTVLLRITPQPSSGGIVGILQDITDLRNLDRLRRELVSNVSHELRTPVTSVLGFLEALRDGLATTDEERQRYLDIIEDETRRLNRLIEDLFDLSKLESGQTGMAMERLDLAGLGRGVAAKLAIAAAKEGLSLEVDAGMPVSVNGDGDRLEQVLLNLLENALRFTPAGGRISLAIQSDPSAREARISVSDTGPGIHPDDLPHVFERFYTGDKSRARQAGEWRGKGTGLGLAIARHIVEAHGGSIEALSIAGQGATFVIRLPLA